MTTQSNGHRSAIVTGANGQDGFYLVTKLLDEGTTVHATVREQSRGAELAGLPHTESLTVHELDVTDSRGCRQLIARLQPTEFYNLAGHSSVYESFADPSLAWRTNGDAVQGLLEAIRQDSPFTTFYQSSSTDMFGSYAGKAIVHDETSPFMPQSPYAAAKAAAHMLCDAYRRAFDLRIACGILSNHESRRRPPSFLTRKVVDHVRQLRNNLAAGRQPGPALKVGNLAAKRDWGFAPDYVDGMIRICRQIDYRAEISGAVSVSNAGSDYRDYVLASGQLHAVWELVDRAFELAGLRLEWDRTSSDPANWSAHLRDGGAHAVVVDPRLIRPSDPTAIGANPARARHELGWEARSGLDPFLKDMLDS
jgi:GDPmannose 4,6-dehydratase